MISIIVQRAPGDSQGSDVSDKLISTELQAIARGTTEINKTCSDRVIVSGSCPARAYMEPGSICAVTDMQQGQYRAMLRSYSLTLETNGDGSFSAVTDITMEREA